MAKRISKNVRELLNDRFIRKKEGKYSGRFYKAFSEEDKAFRKQALEEMYDIRSYNNPESLHAKNLDLNAIEEGALDAYYKPIARSQYIKQESHARQRDIMNVWDRHYPTVDEEGDDIGRDIYSIPMDRLPCLIVDLPPLKQLAVDIVKYLYDEQGPKYCYELIDQTYNQELAKKYANHAVLAEWKENCKSVIRKITSSKNAWTKANTLH